MPINKETIISVFDEKLTLMQWLKTINKALDEAVLTGVEVRQKGNATFSFVVTFEDGTELESNEFVLAQGESINGATIRNGHLYLSLTNGNELDAGNVKPVSRFEINASQHLVVYYEDGTSQDLGTLADFSNADFLAKTLTQTSANHFEEFTITNQEGATIENIYNRFEVINNILYVIINIKITNNTENAINIYQISSGWRNLPTNIANKIIDLNGHSVHEIVTPDCNIAGVELIEMSDPTSMTNITKNGYGMLINIGQENTLTFKMRWANSLQLNAGETKWVMARMNFTLI